MQVDHINLVVKDLEASVAFYRDVLGFQVTMRARLEGEWIETIAGLKGIEADCVYLQPPGSGPRVELLQYLSPETGPAVPSVPNGPGLRHIAFRVDDLDEAYGRLKSLGVRFVSPPVAVPEVVVRHGSGRKRLCYFHDPEGNILELAEFK